jgi:hypothetical protein
MKIETLKKLIAKTCDDISQDNYGLTTDAVAQIREEIFILIDLYEEDRTSEVNNFTPQTILVGLPDEVPYGSICPCNPANGGSGICGCVMGNRMVPNPKKYPGSITTASTDKINITSTNPYSTNITATN